MTEFNAQEIVDTVINSTLVKLEDNSNRLWDDDDTEFSHKRQKEERHKLLYKLTEDVRKVERYVAHVKKYGKCCTTCKDDTDACNESDRCVYRIAEGGKTALDLICDIVKMQMKDEDYPEWKPQLTIVDFK